jgi:hypothetical protein
MRFAFGIAVPLASMFVCGCNPVVTETKPATSGRLAELYFSSPASSRVVVTSLMEQAVSQNATGFEVRNRPMAEQVWVTSGWLQVTYACPDDPQSFYTMKIGISQHDKYYLHCDASRTLHASLLRPSVSLR